MSSRQLKQNCWISGLIIAIKFDISSTITRVSLLQRGNKSLQIISAKLSERYIQTPHDMCSVMFVFLFFKYILFANKDVILSKFEHLLITKQYQAN